MRYFVKYCLLVLSFVLIQFSVQATDYTEQIRNAGTSTDYPGSHVLTIFDHTKVDVEESGLGYFRLHQLFKILDEKGALDMRIMKFAYEPMSAKLQIEKVIIYRKNGNIETLTKDRIYDYPAPGTVILWGAREQMVEIGWLEPGDGIEIEVRKKGYTYALLLDDADERYIPPMRGHYYDIVPFWSDQHILEKSYRLRLPKSKKLNYQVYNGELEVELSVGGEKQGYSFTLRDIKPMKSESNMVSPSNVFTKLLMTTAPNWESKSKWFYGVNEDYGSFESTPEIDKKVNEILVGATNELDSISRLNHWVADNVRYFGLNMGVGEGYTLHKGEMTFEDRCGVCKDKAGMLVCMLRSAGFESYAAMTMAGSRIEDIPADQFNHSVTAVKLANGEFMMLDPTWVPFVRENWSSREQQQNYIIGTAEGEDLQIIPIANSKNHFYKLHGNTELLEDGTLKGELKLIAEGQSDAAFRSQLTRNPYSEWESLMSAELYRKFPQININKISFSDGYDYSKPFEIYVDFVIPDYARFFDGDLIFTPIVASNLFERFNYHLRVNSRLEKRQFPFKDACSKYIVLEEDIKIPAGYQSVTGVHLMSMKKYEVMAASFEGGITAEEGKLRLIEKINLEKRVYDVAEWESFRDALIAQKELAENKIVITQKSVKK